MHDDDKPIGRVLTRREMLALLGGSSAALLAGLSLPGLAAAQDGPTATPQPTPTPLPLPDCVVRPELSAGPYFIDEQLNRVDIRFNPTDEYIKSGTPLRLLVRVSNVTGGVCAPLAGAQIDVWHCDAAGVYSGVRDPGFDTREALWLRGYQVTDDDGIAEFVTIVPGWYPGRAVHIHFKIRTEDGYDFTSQWFFDPAQIEDAYTQGPYTARGLPDVPNEADFIYQRSEGVLTLDMVPLTAFEQQTLGLDAGYTATFDIALDLGDGMGTG